MGLLKTYLDRKDASGKRVETPAEFAERVETSPATVSKLANGKLRPSLELAFRIEEATGGYVPMSSWLRPPPRLVDTLVKRVSSAGNVGNLTGCRA